MARVDAESFRLPSRAIILAVLLPLSLVLTATANRTAGQLLRSTSPSFAWFADAAIPSFLVIAGLYIVLGDKKALSWPRFEVLARRRVVGLSAAWLLLWLGGCVVASLITGHWTTYARGWPLVLAFIVFGPMGEELLFRGLIFSRVREFSRSAIPAITVSTIAFSMHHLSLHAAPHGLAVAQLIFTIPMGVVFALLRERTGSLWPGFVVHIATNMPSVIY